VALIAGRYELVRSRSSLEEVQEWEGFDSALERRVLVLFLRQDLAQDEAALERFWASARARARGGAATGERVLDAGTDAETGCAFLIREWPQEDSRDAPTQVLAVLGSSVSPKLSRRRTWIGLSTVLVLSLGFMALRPAVAGWMDWVNSPMLSVAQSFALPTAAPASTQAPAPVATAAAGRQNTPAPAATPTVKAAATATPGPAAGVQRRVVNTDGQGVALRDAPGGKRLPGKGYDEGATVTALETSGQWTHIKGSDGRQGWVLSVTLAP
jgi:hypothetical protein